MSALPSNIDDIARLARMAQRSGGYAVKHGSFTDHYGRKYRVVYVEAEPTLRRPVKKRRVKP
jgi:hypothetical protein